MNKEIVIVTSAYGADTVRKLGGQAALLPMIKASGADGVEIRHELLTPAVQLEGLASQISAHGLFAVYSVPESLLTEDGQPELERLALHLKNAARLKARTLKLPLGSVTNDTDLSGITAVLKSQPVKLLIENDQTVEGGRISPLIAFFGMVVSQKLPVSMTFDMANWNWLHKSAFVAAREVAAQVAEVQGKDSQGEQGKVKGSARDNRDGSWKDLLAMLPTNVPRGIEFPLEGADLTEVTRYYVAKLKEV